MVVVCKTHRLINRFSSWIGKPPCTCYGVFVAVWEQHLDSLATTVLIADCSNLLAHKIVILITPQTTLADLVLYIEDRRVQEKNRPVQ